MKNSKKIILLCVVASMMLLVNGCKSKSKQKGGEGAGEEDLDTGKIGYILEKEPYYDYLWHIDSKNSRDKRISEKTNKDIPLLRVNESADINIKDAWKITKGKGIIIAVIDDGGDPHHEDLKSNIHSTYDVVQGDSNIYRDGDYISITESSHGNNCAGLISAPINGKGIIGIAPESKVMLIRQDDASDESDIEAFEYAKNNGAKVISCSWGGAGGSEAFVAELKSLYEAGITVLFASGNDGLDLDEPDNVDESEIEWVIGVGASTPSNDVADYSNYGKNIDIIAPGGGTGDSLGILTIDDSGVQGSTINYGLVSNNYTFTNGTSFSTPIVAGVVALMYSVNPNLKPSQIREILISTADKVGGGESNYVDGFDYKRAYGKVNATKAVKEALRLK